ncbi:MAG: ABC transporter ATP-binding protein [Anaerolineales bacterium]|nr:ABC transporter ATP-binding protein [Anaerolineales bacterium]
MPTLDWTIDNKAERRILVDIKDLQVQYPVRTGTLKGVDHVSLEILEGETLGLVGESACGKSTLGRAINRLVSEPGVITGGEILFRGQDLLKKNIREMNQIRGKNISMIFQDPMTSLNPIQRISDHFIETIRTHEPEMSKAESLERTTKMFDNLGIQSERLDDYPHQLSGGMRQRVMIGLALILNSELVIADEPTTSLDVIVEAQILDLLKALKQTFHMTLLLISHNLGIVAELADRIAVMYAGKLMEVAPALALFDGPLHPYTQGLLSSVPNIRLEDEELHTMSGSPPDLINPPAGCRFYPRCPKVMDRCRQQEPPFKHIGKERSTACWLYAD